MIRKPKYRNNSSQDNLESEIRCKPLPDFRNITLINVTAHRERDLRVIENTFFENLLKINLSSKNYIRRSEVALIYELQF